MLAIVDVMLLSCCCHVVCVTCSVAYKYNMVGARSLYILEIKVPGILKVFSWFR